MSCGPISTAARSGGCRPIPIRRPSTSSSWPTPPAGSAGPRRNSFPCSRPRSPPTPSPTAPMTVSARQHSPPRPPPRGPHHERPARPARPCRNRPQGARAARRWRNHGKGPGAMTSGPARPTAHDLGQAPGAALSGSAARVLRVLGLVLDHGPVTPARLTALSGLGRTAVHRAIHALMDQGFIRYQLGKTHVIVTAGLRTRLEGAFFSPAGIDAISAAVEAALKHRRLQCDIAVLPPEGPARIVETTAPDPDLEIDFFGSDLASV